MLTSMRGLFAASLVAGAAIANPAFADETDPPSALTVTGSVSGVTDYRWRGISYSGGGFAVQGSLQVNHASGLYLGAWSSSLQQDSADVYGSSEIDLYGGWTGNLASGLVADVGVTWYTYPNGTNPALSGNYLEPYASLSTTVGPASAKLGINYAPKQDGLGGKDNTYVYGDLGAAIPNTPVSLNTHLGYSDGALSPSILTAAGTKGGWDYSVGATAALTKNLSVGISYIGVDGASIKRFSDDTVVATVKMAF